MASLLREHCLALHDLGAGVHDDHLVGWHDKDHDDTSYDHTHHPELRIQILEDRTARLERRLEGVIETHHLWDGS